MELNEKNNIWLTLYRMAVLNSQEKPNNLCTLFWTGFYNLIVIVTSPIWLLFELGNCLYEKDSLLEIKLLNNIKPIAIFFIDKVLLGLYFFLTLLGYRIIYGPVSKASDISFWGLFYLWIIPTIIIVFIFFIVWKLLDYFSENESFEFLEVPKEAIKAKINKYCPKITWKDKN